MNGPKITIEDIEANISSEAYFTADEGVLGAYKTHNDVYQTVRHDDLLMQPHLERLTICVLVLKNGFTVTGESACASRESFDADKGRKYARENAIEKIWPLMGYELHTKLNKENRELVKKINEDFRKANSHLFCPHAENRRFCEPCNTVPCPLEVKSETKPEKRTQK